MSVVPSKTHGRERDDYEKRRKNTKEEIDICFRFLFYHQIGGLNEMEMSV
jgi:hypothetical protein